MGRRSKQNPLAPILGDQLAFLPILNQPVLFFQFLHSWCMEETAIDTYKTRAVCNENQKHPLGVQGLSHIIIFMEVGGSDIDKFPVLSCASQSLVQLHIEDLP